VIFCRFRAMTLSPLHSVVNWSVFTIYYYAASHALHTMRVIATDGVALSVCLCVCLLVSFVSPVKRLNRSRCHLEADSDGSKEPCISWGLRYPRERGNFGVNRPIQKYWQSLLRCSQQNGSFNSQ